MRLLSLYSLVISIALSSTVFSSCTVYRSPERKDFESEYTDFKVKNLQIKSCSKESVIRQATASKLIFIEPEKYTIWEHQVNQVNQVAIFESNNFKGEYCIYEYIKSGI